MEMNKQIIRVNTIVVADAYSLAMAMSNSFGIHPFEKLDFEIRLSKNRRTSVFFSLTRFKGSMTKEAACVDHAQFLFSMSYSNAAIYPRKKVEGFEKAWEIGNLTLPNDKKFVIARTAWFGGQEA